MLSDAITLISTLRKKIFSFPPSLIKNFCVYAGNGIILKGMSLLALPFIIRALSPADYGQLSLIMTGAAIAATVTGLGLRQMLSLEYFHADASKRNELIAQIIITYCCLGIPLLLMLALLAYYWAITSSILIALTFFYCAISFFNELMYQLLQYESKALMLTLLQCCAAITTVAAQLTFVYYANLGIAGILLGTILGLLIPFCATIYTYSSTTIDIPYKFSLAQNFLKNGLPFIPGMLCAWVIAVGDRWLLARYATMHDVGIYAVTDMATALFQMLILYPLGAAYVPYLLNQFATNKNNLVQIERWNRRMMHMSMIGLSLLSIVAYAIALPFLQMLLPEVYHQALRYMVGITFGNIFLMGTYFASCLIQFHKKTYFLASAFCVPALLNVGINIVAIPRFGIMGCVGATIIAYAGYFGIVVWYNRRLMLSLSNLADIHEYTAHPAVPTPPQTVLQYSTNGQQRPTDYADKNF